MLYDEHGYSYARNIMQELQNATKSYQYFLVDFPGPFDLLEDLKPVIYSLKTKFRAAENWLQTLDKIDNQLFETFGDTYRFDHIRMGNTLTSLKELELSLRTTLSEHITSLTLEPWNGNVDRYAMFLVDLLEVVQVLIEYLSTLRLDTHLVHNKILNQLDPGNAYIRTKLSNVMTIKARDSETLNTMIDEALVEPLSSK